MPKTCCFADCPEEVVYAVGIKGVCQLVACVIHTEEAHAQVLSCGELGEVYFVPIANAPQEITLLQKREAQARVGVSPVQVVLNPALDPRRVDWCFAHPLAEKLAEI